MVRDPRHITPALLAAHYSTLQYHISNRTISATLCVTSCVAPHFTFYVPHVPCTPRHISDYTIYWPHYASHYHISHHTTTLHCISQAAPHVLHNCIIPPHLTVVTPNSTSHYHVDITFHIAHQYTTTRDILHPTTCHISHQ